MKAATVALLLANLLFLGWLYSHPQASRPAIVTETTAFPAPVEPLLLLRERPRSAMSQSDDASHTLAQERASAPTADAASPVPDSAVSTTDISVPAPIRDGADHPETPSALSPEPGQMPAEIVTNRICQTIGPFTGRTRVDAFVSELTALGGAPIVRASHIEQPSGYWVYLPAMPRTEAQNIIDDLSAKGVKDYFLGRQNFVSLGVFSDKRSAEMRLREIESLGYAPRLEPRFLTREVFWVDIEEQSAQSIDGEQWDALLKERADIRRQPVACE